MFGYGRGWFGYGRGWWRGTPNISAPAGYRYIGPCRCGWGPHAFYKDQGGRIVPASEIYRVGLQTTAAYSGQESFRAELETLKEEKRELEKRIAELERLMGNNPR